MIARDVPRCCRVRSWIRRRLRKEEPDVVFKPLLKLLTVGPAIPFVAARERHVIGRKFPLLPHCWTLLLAGLAVILPEAPCETYAAAAFAATADTIVIRQSSGSVQICRTC